MDAENAEMRLKDVRVLFSEEILIAGNLGSVGPFIIGDSDKRTEM